MQDRYAGDVGDFGKYGLLRALVGGGLRMGVVWYRTDPCDVGDRPHQDDGKHRSYLARHAPRFRECDPDLHDRMQAYLDPAHRSVANVATSGVFPLATRFYEPILGLGHLPSGGPVAQRRRLDHRADWLRGALDATRNAEFVFLDPDNGLECDSTAPHHQAGPKYVALSELSPFIERGQSLVVYHHIGRSGGNAEQQTRAQLRRVGSPGFGLLFRRGTCRAFLVLPASGDHARELRSRADQLIAGPWGRRGHFDREIIER
jgi:hypothetical protein